MSPMCHEIEVALYIDSYIFFKMTFALFFREGDIIDDSIKGESHFLKIPKFLRPLATFLIKKYMVGI